MKSKQISESITNDLKSILNLTENFNNLSNVSKIDIDLALEKTRNLYDKLLIISSEINKNNNVTTSNKTNDNKIIDNTEKQENQSKNILKKIFSSSDKEKNTEEITKNEKNINKKTPNQTELLFNNNEQSTQNTYNEIHEKIKTNTTTEETQKTEKINKPSQNTDISTTTNQIINEPQKIEKTEEENSEILDFVDDEIITNENTEQQSDNNNNKLENYDKNNKQKTINELNEFEDANINETPETITPEAIDEVKEMITETENDLNTKLTINDLIARVNKNKGVGEKLAETPIANIKSAINLNDKIWYINNLFDGNTEDYDKTIDTLNNFNNIEQALEFINNRFNLDEEKDSLNSFLKLIYRRFL